MKIRLDWSQCFMAAMAGVMRRLRALRRRIPDVEGRPEVDLWGNDIESAGAELAFSLASGCVWYGPGTDGKPDADVGPYQVRHTKYPDGCLMVKKHDRDDQTFFLVTGSLPEYRVVGSVVGSAARREEWWRTVRGRSAWFVPQDALTPFEEHA